MSRATFLALALLVALAAAESTAAAQVPIPELISPEEGAVLDNGRTDRLNYVVWDFDWSDCPGATAYHLYVIGATASIPVIDNAGLTQSAYHTAQLGSYVTDFNRFDWTWKVRAQVGGVWGDWSPERTFDVEPVNTDPQNVFRDLPDDHWALTEIMAAYLADIVTGYEEGTYHPEYPVTRDQMAVFISRAMADGDANVPAGPGTATFDDVPTDYWSYKYIEYCVANDIVQGYNPVTYGPTDIVSRDTMAVFIARAVADGDANVPAGPAEATFDDVPTDYWSYKYIEYCVANDVVQGYDAVTYGPANLVNRDSMAVFIARAVAGGDAGVPDGPAEATFDDVPTDYWSYKHIEYCAAEEIVQGYDPVTYGPAGLVTRDQMAVFITRAFGLS